MYNIRRRVTGCPRSQIQSSYRRRLKTGVSGRGWLNGPGVFGQRKKETPHKKAGIRRSGAAHAAPLQSFTGRPHDCKRERSRGPSHRPRQRKRSYFGRYAPAQETTWYFPLALTSFHGLQRLPRQSAVFGYSRYSMTVPPDVVHSPTSGGLLSILHFFQGCSIIIVAQFLRKY